MLERPLPIDPDWLELLDAMVLLGLDAQPAASGVVTRPSRANRTAEFR